MLTYVWVRSRVKEGEGRLCQEGWRGGVRRERGGRGGGVRKLGK